MHHANNISTPTPGFKCDNCGNPHFMNQCPKNFDNERIARNRKAHGDPPSNSCGGGNEKNGGRGCSGGNGCGRGSGSGRGCGGNYGQGNFSSPAKNKTVCVVNSKTYTTCKDCLWNSGDRAHTSVSHELSSMSRYSVTFALNTNMNNLLGAANVSSGSDHMSDNGSGDGSVNSLAATMMDTCFIIEKDDSDPYNAAFAGKSGGFLQYLMK